MGPRRNRRLRAGGLTVVGLLALVAAACGGRGDSGTPLGLYDSTAVAQSTDQTPAVVAEPASGAPDPIPRAPFLDPSATVTPAGDPIIRSEFRPRIDASFTLWGTNWKIRLIDVNELVSGGVPRDGIESIDAPKFQSLAEVAALYGDETPVIRVEIDGDARAYPLQILSWHEVVNDVVGGVPVVVTFCPLCNSALAYERRVEGEVFEFGVSGALRNSDLVMYDRTTESLWQQIGGKALVGDMVGAVLTPRNAQILSFAQFRASHPDGVVLSQDTGTSRERDYSISAYRGYDSALDEAAFDVAHAEDRRLAPFERVVALRLADEAVAYPFSALSELRVINDRRAGLPVVVFWTPGTVSALDEREILDSRDVGSSGVFRAERAGLSLTFRPDPDDPKLFRDQETDSTWNIVGEAVDGPLIGTQLEPLIHANHFWFAWVAFEPETIIVTSEAVVNGES